ncbi:hypothetical protein [Streptomyces sp. NPDC088762]
MVGIRAEAAGALATRRGVPLSELSDERASLEEAHLDLTAGRGQFSASAA